MIDLLQSNGMDDLFDLLTPYDLMLASQDVLAKLWITDEEDEAWADLNELPEILGIYETSNHEKN